MPIIRCECGEHIADRRIWRAGLAEFVAAAENYLYFKEEKNTNSTELQLGNSHFLIDTAELADICKILIPREDILLCIISFFPYIYLPRAFSGHIAINLSGTRIVRYHVNGLGPRSSSGFPLALCLLASRPDKALSDQRHGRDDGARREHDPGGRHVRRREGGRPRGAGSRVLLVEVLGVDVAAAQVVDDAPLEQVLRREKEGRKCYSKQGVLPILLTQAEVKIS